MSISPITFGGDLTSACGAFPQGLAAEKLFAAENDREASVVDLVMKLAQSHPDAIAVSAGKDTLTFGELGSRSKRMASYLVALGAGPEIPIGLCLERSFDFIVSALAVLMSGAAYLPLDPTWPPARLRAILEGAEAPLVISRGELTKRVATDGARTIDLETAASFIESLELLADPVAITRE